MEALLAGCGPLILRGIAPERWRQCVMGLAAALTDFSAETEFPSSQHKKYPDTEAVVPYQPSNINVLEIGTNWMLNR